MRPYAIGFLALMFIGYLILAWRSLKASALAGEPVLKGSSLIVRPYVYPLNLLWMSAILALHVNPWQAGLLAALLALPLTVGMRFKLGERGLQVGPTFVPREKLLGYSVYGDSWRRIEVMPKQGKDLYRGQFKRKLKEDEIADRLAAYFAAASASESEERGSESHERRGGSANSG
ncbi:hypothetical protein [Gorillibacterium sp. sgz500922]|uniref:hypothetical protein n=1 Tax=Gorillibacterium sp. sgz500922 TaxID=3446694 RepID=UPI003F662D5A